MRAIQKDSGAWFFSDSQGRKYNWLGTLKSLYIQHIIHELAQDISRIGTIESEWYRKS